MPEISQATADKAAAIQREFNSSVTAFREDRGLTPEGKRQRMAAAYLRAEEAMNKLRSSWREGAQASAQVLNRDIFGAASTAGVDAISARDADDRAAQLQTADEALPLLSRAEENGDKVLARAIAQRAYRERGNPFGGWGLVLEAYTENRPDVARKLSELEAARRDTFQTNFTAGIVFSLHQPAELNNLHNLAAVANGSV